jgi:hypothetical protein
VREEKRLAVERDAVRDADVADRAAGTGGANGLLHCLLRTDTLQDGVGADPAREFPDASHALVAALGHDVSRAKLAGELLP